MWRFQLIVKPAKASKTSKECFAEHATATIIKKCHVLRAPSMSANDVVETYLKFHREQLDSDFWAWEEVDELVRVDPDSSWDLILALLSQTETMEQIAYVAAGPVEDWINHYGDSHLQLLKNELLSNSKLQTAITVVNLPRNLQSSTELIALRELYRQTR